LAADSRKASVVGVSTSSFSVSIATPRQKVDASWTIA
jgi:hypothetical protein